MLSCQRQILSQESCGLLVPMWAVVGNSAVSGSLEQGDQLGEVNNE